MKLLGLCIAIFMCGFLFIGTSTSQQLSNTNNADRQRVNIQIGEYPPPLDVNGLHKYHVVINGTLIGMPAIDVSDILDTYNIKPRNRDDFHKNDSSRFGIWAQLSEPTIDNNISEIVGR